MGTYQEHIYKAPLRIFALAARRPVAVAVMLHGGGWVAALPLQFELLSQALARHHISSLSIEYTVRARQPSAVYDSLADVQAAIPFVRQFAGSLPIVLIGASAGGLLAFHLSINKILSPAGAILLNPVLDLSATGFISKATPPGGDETISPLHLAIDASPPILIAHGGADTIVPIAASEQLTARFSARGLPIDLHSFPNAGHGFWHLRPHRDSVTRLVENFIFGFVPSLPADPPAPVRAPPRPRWLAAMSHFLSHQRGPKLDTQVQPAATPSEIRLVIWDLDDTFWSGTLTEGGVRIIERNVAIVKTLAARGIISSICSKNDVDKAQAELQRAGILDYFVFRRIAWAAKGAMIRSIVESSQLRPENIVFIDDNPLNLNEVHHYNPDLQLADPFILDGLLDDARLAGKDDRDLTRLAQYRVLEAKEIDRAGFADAGTEFLRQSEIQISFHHDILGEFDRVHELINRTNQLNFTKRRMSEDRNEAYDEIQRELRNNPGAHTAYIKVSDKYGEYGIVGLYMTVLSPTGGRDLKHFLFSCRTLNMGIEQFVFSKLGMVKLEIVGEVVAELSTKTPIDWITVVADAEQRVSAMPDRSLLICLRGGCELDQVVHYLGHQFKVVKEFPFPHRGWGVPMPAAQFASIFEQLQQPEHELMFKRLPSLHPALLESRFMTGKADVFIVSFTMEEQWSHFRFKETGLVLPIKLQHGAGVSAAELTRITYEQVRQHTKIDFSEDDWRWFQDSFEYLNEFDPVRFATNISDLLARVAGKKVIVVLSNTRHGRRSKALTMNAELNAIVERVAVSFDPYIIRMDDLIVGEHEVINAYHYRREVYPRLADAIKRIIDDPSADLKSGNAHQPQPDAAATV